MRLTGGGGHHADRYHPAGWLSSAFYVALPKPGEGDQADAGHLVLGEFDELGIYLPPLRVTEPGPGRLALFPSTMSHGTRPFGDGEDGGLRRGASEIGEVTGIPPLHLQGRN
ncbi:MAG TPA: putative 2OG-Fe(II) oxygenase [Allosphingosinicella sp.]